MTGPAWAAGSRCNRVRCGGAKGDCRKVATLRRRAQYVELAAQGTSYDDIAKAAGFVNRGGAHNAISAALKAHQADAVDHLREMEVQRLDGLQAPVCERALAGVIRAVDAVVRIIQARVKRLGLDQSETSAGRRLVSAEWRGGLAWP